MTESTMAESPNGSPNEATDTRARQQASEGEFTITLAAAARTLRAQGLTQATGDAVSAWYASHAGHPMDALRAQLWSMPRAAANEIAAPQQHQEPQQRELLRLSVAGWTLRVACGESGGLSIDIERQD